MKNTLLVDIGNSSTVFAPFSEGQLGPISTVVTGPKGMKAVREAAQNAVRTIISSVVPDIESPLRSLPNVHFVDHTNVPIITLNLEKPWEVGADRITNALGAFFKHQKACLVVDSGTALTFCYVTEKGVYEGGVIFPGMGICARALHDYTAKIPLIWVKPIGDLVGKTTESAVQVGLFQGTVALINGMIARFRAANPDVLVIGTGTGLETLADHIHLDAYEPQLIFEGLAVCAGFLGSPGGT